MAEMPRVGREVAMVLQVEREVTVVSRLKCEVAAVLRVNRRLVGRWLGGIALLSFQHDNLQH